MALSIAPDPDKWISCNDMAARAGVSPATAKRMVTDGKLPKPMLLGKRKVGFRQGDVSSALETLAAKHPKRQ